MLYHDLTGLDIIDFHTHPFADRESNICSHTEYCDMSKEKTKEIMAELGISRFCGSVIRRGMRNDHEEMLAQMYKNNQEALELAAYYGGAYIPGFHIHPLFVRESCEEVERMRRKGVRLIGELVPYKDGWSSYDSTALSEILALAEEYDMIVSLHTMAEDSLDVLVKRHPHLRIVAAHPGEYDSFSRHLQRFKMSENYYIDLSGYGIFRYGMLRHAIDVMGVERILFGSDYPTCAPGMYVGGVLYDFTVTDREKEKIFSGNAKALLGLS